MTSLELRQTFECIPVLYFLCYLLSKKLIYLNRHSSATTGNF